MLYKPLLALVEDMKNARMGGLHYRRGGLGKGRDWTEPTPNQALARLSSRLQSPSRSPPVIFFVCVIRRAEGRAEVVDAAGVLVARFTTRFQLVNSVSFHIYIYIY